MHTLAIRRHMAEAKALVFNLDYQLQGSMELLRSNGVQTPFLVGPGLIVLG